jgi:hypothetical protein
MVEIPLKKRSAEKQRMRWEDNIKIITINHGSFLGCKAARV